MISMGDHSSAAAALKKRGDRRRPQEAAGVQEQAPRVRPSTSTVYVKESPSPMADAPQGNSLGMAAMIVATCGIVLYWLPWVNLICPAGAVIFGTIALQLAGKQKATGKLPAITGLILGGVLFLIGLFVIEVALSLTAVLDQSGEATP